MTSHRFPGTKVLAQRKGYTEDGVMCSDFLQATVLSKVGGSHYTVAWMVDGKKDRINVHSMAIEQRSAGGVDADVTPFSPEEGNGVPPEPSPKGKRVLAVQLHLPVPH